MFELVLGLVALFLAYRILRFILRLLIGLLQRFWIFLSGGAQVEEGSKISELLDLEPSKEAKEAQREGEEIPQGAYADEQSRQLLWDMDKIQKKNPLLRKKEERRELRELKSLYERQKSLFMDQIKLNWYQLVVIFFLGSILGLLLEQVWMLITAGLTESRVGLVWGPFSPLYGFGASFMTLVSVLMRKKHAHPWQVFLISALIGGGLEQLTGWGMEHLFHASSWSYAHLPDAISQWVAWRFLGMWGILGIIWAFWLAPELLYRIGLPTSRRQILFVILLALYLGSDIWMTVACFQRKTQRDQGIPAHNAFEHWVDEHYGDQFIEGRFQNLVIERGKSD